MSLMRYYEPLTLLNNLQSLFDNNVLNRTDNGSAVETSQWSPSVDIKEESNRFVLLADVPGVNPQNIEIHMENQVLTIKGERSAETKEERDNYSRIERVKGMFYRRFTLPDSADGENITARCQQGVLEISIPKKEQSKPRKITIHAVDDAKK